jgi:monovalent cation/proton antiporter MnhG/PhaG subunit
MGLSVTSVLVDSLVAFGLLIELGCCVGVFVMRDAYDQLHYTGPAAILGPVAFAGAIVIQEGLSQAGVKAVLVAALLIVANPVLTHATGRALYIRRRDHLEPTDAGAAGEQS